jgi:hypothetical protein
MSKAKGVSTPTPNTPLPISDNAVALRLLHASITLQRYGERWRLLSSAQVLLDRGPDGTPCSLEQIEAITRRLGI